MNTSRQLARSAAMARSKSTAVARKGSDNAVERGGRNGGGGQVARRQQQGPLSFDSLVPSIMADPFRAMETMDRAMNGMARDMLGMMTPFMPRGALGPMLFGRGGVGASGLLEPFGRGAMEEMNRTLERTVGRSSIAVDIAEFSDRYEIHAELPGVDKSSLRVDVDEEVWPHTLTITAQKTITMGGPNTGEGQQAAEGQGENPADASRVVDVKQGEEQQQAASSSAGDSAKGRGHRGGHGGKDVAATAKGGRDNAVQAWHRTERLSGTISRTIGLPEDADIAGIGAKLANGVLTVSVPRRALSEAEEVPGRRAVRIE